MRAAAVTAVTRADLLRARSLSHRRRVADAQRVVAACLERSARPYVALSGGKDSLCVLAIAARLRPGIDAIWSDDELEYPPQPDYVPRAAGTLGAKLTILLGWAQHAGWFSPWRDQPYWREPVAGSLHIGQPVESWSGQQGWDAALLGLRGAESTQRRIALRSRGPTYQVADGQWRCNPLASWTVDDVWALIAGWELPYSPAYDRLAAIGVPRDLQRIGPLPLSPGWVLHAGWPDVYQRLVARYGPRW
jgi:3'-phosphoadenosine 5'-phosphosulfate sulfotransferase (PAPS reductase)/FAD synthetase